MVTARWREERKCWRKKERRKDTRQNVTEKRGLIGVLRKERKSTPGEEEKRQRQRQGGRVREKERERGRRNVRAGASSALKKRKKKKRMVLVQQGPQDTGKEYPRTVEDASIPSPSFSYPFQTFLRSLLPSSSSAPLFPGCKYAPPARGSRQDLLLAKGIVVSFKRYTDRRDVASLFPPTDFGAPRFSLPFSLAPPLYALRDFRTDCEIKGSSRSLK